MRAAAYIRVSTSGQNLDGQRRTVESYVEAQGFDATWFSDKASGKDTDRPGWQSLVSAIGRREINTVVVWKLDRAFRNALDCLRTVDEWDRVGVSLRVIDLGGQPVDTKAAAGKFMLTVVAAVAEMERATSRERQSAGIQAVRAKNGGRCPWGGRKLGTATIDYARAEELRRRGLTVSEIASSLGCSKSSLYGALRDRGLVRNYSRRSG